MQPLKEIDNLLNKITMYRLLVYGLSALLAIAMLMSAVNRLAVNLLSIVLTIVVILIATFIADRSLPVLFNVTSNKDSSLITALILCLILPPSVHLHKLALLALGGLLAVGSKYVLAYHRKHIFNPAAFAAFILGITSLLPAIWWIGSPILLPFTVIFGLLVLRKIRRFQMFGAFLIASLLIATLVGLHNSESIGYIMSTAFRSSPLIFLGSVMLTEPSTLPPRLWQQYIYAIIVGGIFTSQLHTGTLSATPELALLIGNVYSYIVSPKYKLKLAFVSKQEIGPNIYDFSFKAENSFQFEPGQYLEWTLPIPKADSRGNRRIFSIASAPGEEDVHFAVRVAESGSAFKSHLMNLEPGDTIIAGQLAGDFILPSDQKKKISLIAGGIGITPFVSMAKTMVKLKERRDITLFYLVSSPNDYCYAELWSKAAPLGLNVIPVLTNNKNIVPADWSGLNGRLSESLIKKNLPDYADRRFYISGPPGLVDSYAHLLRKLSIHQKNIVTDHFSGY